MSPAGVARHAAFASSSLVLVLCASTVKEFRSTMPLVKRLGALMVYDGSVSAVLMLSTSALLQAASAGDTVAVAAWPLAAKPATSAIAATRASLFEVGLIMGHS